MHYVIFFFTLSLAAQAFALKFTDCGSKTGKIIDVQLSGCEDSDMCELKRGETYVYGLTFESHWWLGEIVEVKIYDSNEEYRIDYFRPRGPITYFKKSANGYKTWVQKENIQKILTPSELSLATTGRGHNITVLLTESQTLKAVVHGIVGGISMPYPLPNADACDNSNIECPLENGKTYAYVNEIEIRKSYPSVRADVKWELKDENNQDVACILIPVKIV